MTLVGSVTPMRVPALTSLNVTVTGTLLDRPTNLHCNVDGMGMHSLHLKQKYPVFLIKYLFVLVTYARALSNSSALCTLPANLSVGVSFVRLSGDGTLWTNAVNVTVYGTLPACLCCCCSIVLLLLQLIACSVYLLPSFTYGISFMCGAYVYFVFCIVCLSCLSV